MIETKRIMIPVLMVTIVSFTSLISIIYAGKEDKPKQYCEDYGGEWSVKKDRYEIENEKERTYFEDDVCDDPDDSLRYPNVCQPWVFDDDEDDYLNIFNSFYFGINQV